MGGGELAAAAVGVLPQRPAALGDHFRRQVTRLAGGLRPGAGRVTEHMVVREGEVGEPAAGAVEGGVGLPGESHDHIGAEAEPGHRFRGALRELPVLPGGVAAAHPFENGVVAALRRQVEVAAEFPAVRHSPQQPLLHRRGFDGGDADALDPGDLLQMVGDIGERAPPAAVPPDVHAGEHQFAVAGLGEFPGLAQQVVEAAAALPAPGVGNDAERTEEVAAVLHLQVGAGRVVPPGRRNLELFAGDPRRVEDDRLGQFPRTVEVVGEGVLELRSDDQVHAGDLPEGVQAGLRVAAGDDHEGVGGVAERPAHGVAAVRLRPVRDRTGVDDGHFRRFAPGDDRVAFVRELPRPGRGLGVVQATTERSESGPRHGAGA